MSKQVQINQGVKLHIYVTLMFPPMLFPCKGLNGKLVISWESLSNMKEV